MSILLAAKVLLGGAPIIGWLVGVAAYAVARANGHDRIQSFGYFYLAAIISWPFLDLLLGRPILFTQF